MKRLIILLLIVGCSTEPEDCAGVAGGTAVIDNCGVCEGTNTDGICAECGDGYVLLWEVCYSIENTTGLDLSFNQLTGEIPSEIGNLTNLTYLSLFDNQLTGEIPVEIGNLTNLTVLDLSHNQLTGEIPQAVCDLIERNMMMMEYILTGNNFPNTCN